MKGSALNRICAFVSALCLTAGALGCFLTVYELPLKLDILVLSLTAAAVLGSLCLPLHRGKEITAAASALTLAWLLHLPETIRQMKTLLVLVSRDLDTLYSWGYFFFPGLQEGNVELPLGIYGGILCLAVCRSVLRRKLCVLPLLLAAPPIALCALVPGKDPTPWAVFALLSASACLLLTSTARRTSALQGMKLTLTAAVPVALCAGLLLLCNPQSTYIDRSAPIREKIIARLNGSGAGKRPYSFVPQVNYTADLASLTGGDHAKVPVLTVTAPKSGSVYLRGQDFDTYTGTGWTADPQRMENFDGWGEELGSFSVKTFSVQDVIYLPYYPGTGTILTGGALANTGGSTDYSFPNRSQGSALSQQALAVYCTLPEETLVWARGKLPEEATAEAIGAMVENSAEYDLSAPQMPETRQDFVRWFLEESDRGYCVHFASTAVVLLRAAGIPARYVTGFRQDVAGGRPCMVTTRQAHAWAEYYDTARGCWQILDATPAEAWPEATQEETAAQREQEQSRQTQSTGQELPVPSEEQRSSALVWLILPGMFLLLVLRRYLILAFRESRKRRAPARKRVLLLWQEAEELSKALKKEIPEELVELAQRAQFSQHRITAMDAVPLETYCQDCRERLQKLPVWKRLAARYLFVQI